MKLNFSKTFTISLIATALLLSGCVDGEKDLYDPDFRAKNPMGDIVAPEGSDWQLSTTVELTVKVADEYNGQHYYIIDVFDANPAISADAHLLDKGVAKSDQPFATKLSVSKAIQTLYIRQTTPTGLASIRACETAGGNVDCNFGASTAPAARSAAMTRNFVEIKAPDATDTSLFPQSAPQGIEIFKEGKAEQGGSYEVKSGIQKINLGGAVDIKLYVTGNIALTEQIYLTKGSKLYLLPGVTVTMPQTTNNGQENCLISIGKNATFKAVGEIKLDKNYKLYNLGTVSADKFSCTNNSIFYNGGTATITKSVSGQNEGGIILNDGELTTTEITIAGNSHIVNQKTVNVKTTTLNCTNGSWENEGSWTTDAMNISAWNDFSINKCKLIVNQQLNLREAKLINDAGSYIRCSSLYMNNTLVELGSKSLFVVTEQAKYGYQVSRRGFKGTGTEKALLKIEKAIAENDTKADIIHYAGNLQIACNNHPEADLGWGKRWTMTNGAEWANPATATVSIPKTECNEGSSTTPTPPKDPDFPIIVEPKEKHSLLFEDQWPLYGDYDMNDIVIELGGFRYSLNEKNKIDKFSFSVILQAVGAEKAIAAAVMLDKISASTIESIEHEGTPQPTTFSTTSSGVESGQQYAVIPLFDDAHKLMKRNNRMFINTQSGSSNNVSVSEYPEMEITIKLKNNVSKSDFNISNINFFIITDNAAKRKEIHMAGFKPSDLANTVLFGGNDDGSSLSGSKYYVSKENLAWGIIVPQQFKWPLEYHNIKDVYSEFKDWVTSGGIDNTKWYNTFDNTKTFRNDKN